MSPDASTLAFLLDSPLQSWGESSRFNRRGTGPHPTKSGIVALLACARGIDKNAKDETELLASLADFRLTTVLLPRIEYNWRGEARTDKDGKLRSHRPLRFTDYHTIGGGFDDKREPLRKPRKAGGGVFDTVQTWRDYLLDSRFAIFLQGDSAELEACVADFQNPRWGLWLGRKSCIPSVPILPELYSDLHSAWVSLVTKAGFPTETPFTSFDRCLEVTTPDAASFILLDQPVSFGKRLFHARPVRRLSPGELP
jgi:CRISPR system Cascade subunit CasD